MRWDRCDKCGSEEAVYLMCDVCINELVDRCVARIRELQSEVGRLQRLVQGEAIHVNDPAAGRDP